MAATGQRTFDFSDQAALERHLVELGLNLAERRIMLYVWQHGEMRDNCSMVVVAVSALSKAIGYSRRWTQESRDNLIAFGLMLDIPLGEGRAKAYRVDWSRVRTMTPRRAPETEDLFALYESRPVEPEQTPSEVGGAEGVQSGVHSGGALGGALGGAEGGALGGAPHTHSVQTNPPQNSQPQTQSCTEGWGRDVSADELRGWQGRSDLFRLACDINPLIDQGDYDDKIGFLAAVLCALDRGRNPPALLLEFVRGRAWRFRDRKGNGLGDVWISRAKTALREREREKARV